MLKIGVLALQGSVEEHLKMLETLGDVESIPVKTTAQLDQIDGLILPGGESTTQAKLLHDFNLMEHLRTRITTGMPVWGTCAGLILLAREIVGETAHLGLLDVVVRRNAYGRQLDSFQNRQLIPAVSPKPLELVFIRAPWIEAASQSVEILAEIDGHIVAARQNHILGTSFHPELTGDSTFHRYFAQMVRKTCLPVS